MEKVAITEEMILAAHDYWTNAAKEEWVAKNAPKCFDKLSIKVYDEPMPEMYILNTGLKNRYLMYALVCGYLRQAVQTEERDDNLLTEEEYDRWAGSHVVNEIERWKRSSTLRNKCFDILYDYHDLEKRFSAQINGLLAVQNDYVLRNAQYSATQMKELPGVLEQLKELQQAREAKDG